eukprot:1054831-Rhodomonas_salina.2
MYGYLVHVPGTGGTRYLGTPGVTRVPGYPGTPGTRVPWDATYLFVLLACATPGTGSWYKYQQKIDKWMPHTRNMHWLDCSQNWSGAAASGARAEGEPGS